MLVSLWLSLKLAVCVTFILLLVGLPLAYWLAYSRSRLKIWIQILTTVPLVLPPSVLGFYWLLVFSPQHIIGNVLQQIGLSLIFSFEGLVLGSVLYSMPFMISPLQTAFEKLNPQWSEVAALLGKSPISIFFQIMLPNLKTAILSACTLTFAHTLGEFGVVLMIGGNIPRQTRTASIAIYSEVEALNYDAAHYQAFILLIISFLLLFVMFFYRSQAHKGNRLLW